MGPSGFIHLNELFLDAYGFDGKDLFKQPFIELESIGARKKFWFRYKGHSFMYKTVSGSIYEAYGELLSQSIARVLDIPCAHYMLADLDYEENDIDDFKDSQGVITVKFLQPGERLVPFGEIISQVLNSSIFSNPELEKLYDIEHIKQSVAVFKMNNLEDIWPILDLYFHNL